MITALTVNYNTPGLLKRLLVSFRKFYDIPYVVIDGSDKSNYQKIKGFDEMFNVQIHHFPHNIHHGPGMEYGIKQIKTDQILVLDSDIIVLDGGWIERMQKELRPTSYGIGDIQRESMISKPRLNPRKFNDPEKKIKIEFPYLHPACMLINKSVVMRYPMPIKGGAPMIMAMYEIYIQNVDILQRSELVTQDFWKHTKKYIQHHNDHKGMGTVVETMGYHLP